MRFIICSGLLAVSLLGAATAHAQYPARPIRFIVPFTAGSANDMVARFVGTPLSDALGRPVIIDNRPGAGGNIGAEVAAKSPANGYTWLMGNIALAINMTLYDKPGYDLAKDFVPVSMLASGSFMMMAHPSLPVTSVKELISFAKARPGEINVATSGGGIYLSSALFQDMSGIKMTNVTYRTSSITALISGEVSVGFTATSTAIPHVKSGKLRGLAVTSARRSPMAPDIPTLAETGLKGYEASSWYGLLVPAKTPADIISRLNAESVKVLGQPEVKERFGTTDLVPAGSTPEQFGAYIRNEIAKWGKLVKASNLRPE